MVVAGALGGRALAAVGEEAGEDAGGVSGTGVSSDMGWSGSLCDSWRCGGHMGQGRHWGRSFWHLMCPL